MFVEKEARFFSWVFKLMDSEVSSFQSGLTPILPANVPPRLPTAMPAGALGPWTPRRVLAAAATWVMEETHLPDLTTQNRRA